MPRYGRDGYWSILLENLLNPKEAFKRGGTKFLYERSPFPADIINEPGGWKALHRTGCREINMLELGSGSGIVPLDVLCNAKNNGARVNLALVDQSQSALEFSEGIAQ